MKINAAITMLFNNNGLEIEIDDRDAGVLFCKMNLTSEQVTTAFSRLSHTHVDQCEIREQTFPKLGKTMIVKDFIFETKDIFDTTKKIEDTKQKAIKVCPKGWEIDLYFRSQDSFFHEDGKYYARTRVRKWVDKSEILNKDTNPIKVKEEKTKRKNNTTKKKEDK